ncbi:MAG TPA: fused MFS/spermidine synthase, partial [Candidatus Sumerlaeia bacterium]|nr:fused MFS/spermidine synthase [Candidatus Sumerlaeia bacterium]
MENNRKTAVQSAVFALFFLSGVSGLIYEVVWSRHLIYLFGATLYAVSTTLAAFMGGMALGSYLFGRYADRARNSLRVYGWLQLGIGVAGLALPFMLLALDPIYRVAYRQLTSFFILSLLRFVLTFIILLIPATLMGGTLPVLSRYLVHKRDWLGLNIGALYSVNTLGAVLGCFAAGFLLIETFGVRGATYFAAGINFIVGAAGLLLALRSGEEARSEERGQTVREIPDGVIEDAQKSRRIILAVLISYGVSGFIALSYQVSWNRALVFTFDIMKNTTFSFTAMLTVFLIGLAIGGALMSVFVDRAKDHLRLYAMIQLLLGLSGAYSLFVIYYFGGSIAPFEIRDASGQINWWMGVLNVFSKTFASIFLPTFLMGMAFPVAARICVARMSAVGYGVGRLYSVNTLGSILGSFASGFILIPILGVAGTIAILALGNLAIALYMFHINPAMLPRSRNFFIGVCVFAMLLVIIRIPRHARFQELSKTERMLFYEEGSLATVSVLEDSFKYRTLYVDNVGVAGTDRILLTDQKSLAHVPMLLLPNPKSALTVGFGSGGASYSYTCFKSLEEIHCVEICKEVLDAAPYLFASNRGVLIPEGWGGRAPREPSDYKYLALPGYMTFDARYKIIIDDVRSYLRFTGRVYDIIATDCTDLRYKSNANLYDYEYFKLCREHLSDDGMVVVWMPLGGLSDETFRLALRTFYRVFPEMTIWYMNNEPTHYILIIGTPKPLRVDYALMKKRLEEESVRQDLAELFLDDADKILSCFLNDNQSLKDYLAGEKINSENRPYLEFLSPKYGYGDKPMIDNLNTLLKYET